MNEDQPGPKVTSKDIEDNIDSVHYFTGDQGVYGAVAFVADSETKVSDVEWHAPPPLDLVTFCMIVTKSGFTVTGISACVSRENYDFEKGKQVAYDHAKSQLWPLMGYALKERLFRSN